jgi:hypothetical protein
MTDEECADKDAFWNLVRRYNQVAEQMPSAQAVTEDLDARSTARVILAECARIKEQIDAILARYRR